MTIKNILISQPAPTTDRSPFSDLATKHKVELTYRPFIEVEGVEFKDFRKQKIEILDHTAVVMTSRNAADHYFRIAEESRITIPDTMKYLCVSEAIANYLQKYIVYRKRRIFFGAGTVPALMEVVKKHKKEKCFVPLTSPHRPDIPTMLSKAGVKYNIAILSNTVSAKLNDIDPDTFDIVVLYTPADVTSFQENFPDSKRKFKLAIFGMGTARAALKAGVTIDLMVPTPEFPSMVMALDEFIMSCNSGKNLSAFALTSLPESPKPAAKTEKSIKRSENPQISTK